MADSFIVALATLLWSNVPDVFPFSVQTSGGITYLINTGTYHVCTGIEVGPVGRTGTNLTVTLTERRPDYCIACVGCYYTETNTTVLGALPPDAYQLTIFYSQSGLPGDIPFLVMKFEVPASEARTITLGPAPSGLRLAVIGVPSATYVIEGSSTLTNWTAVHTSTGAPFSVDVSPPSSAGYRFYRVRVLSGRTTTPVILPP